jgi:polyferredoxin
LPKGLIRYATERAITDRLTAQQIRQHMMRPRVLIYTSLLLIIITVFAICLLMRTPLKMDVIRDRGSMGREIEDGAIENVYRLQIMNTAEKLRHFHLSVEGIDTIALETADDIVVEGATSLVVPVRVRADHGKGVAGSNRIHFKLQATDDQGVHVNEKAVFLIPR